MLSTEFAEVEQKVHKFCHENKLEFDFECSKFPIVAVVKPKPEKLMGQLFERVEEVKNTNFVNGEIRFIFSDELQIIIKNDFSIEDVQFNEIKNMFKKLHYLYLQMYFKQKTQGVC